MASTIDYARPACTARRHGCGQIGCDGYWRACGHHYHAPLVSGEIGLLRIRFGPTRRYGTEEECFVGSLLPESIEVD